MSRKAGGWLVIVMLLSLLLAACQPASANQAPAYGGMEKGAAPAAEPPMARESTSNSGIADSTGQGSTVERLVIKNAELSIVVAKVKDSTSAIARMADEMGGFVVSSNSYMNRSSSGLETPAARITIRVPAEKLDAALEQIKALTANRDEDVLNESISGQDVTKDYTDLKSRLTNLEQAEKQLQNIMDGATKTEDVLQVYNQLVSVREQIEVIKGQMKYYEEAAALSAINVTLSAQEAVEPLSIGGWKPVGVARDALQALITVLKWLANAAIYLVIFCLPVGLVIGVPLYFAIRAGRRLAKRRKAQAIAPVEGEVKK